LGYDAVTLPYCDGPANFLSGLFASSAYFLASLSCVAFTAADAAAADFTSLWFCNLSGCYMPMRQMMPLKSAAQPLR
jgi:hypothetical protein